MIKTFILFLKLKKGLKAWIITIVFYGSMALNFACLSRYDFNALNLMKKIFLIILSLFFIISFTTNAYSMASLRNIGKKVFESFVVRET